MPTKKTFDPVRCRTKREKEEAFKDAKDRIETNLAWLKANCLDDGLRKLYQQYDKYANYYERCYKELHKEAFLGLYEESAGEIEKMRNKLESTLSPDSPILEPPRRDPPQKRPFFFESPNSSSSSLNEYETHLQADMAASRVERDESEKRELTLKIDNLHQEYTTAMHIVYTSMYVAFQIHNLVQFGKELYKDNPEVLEGFAEKPLVEFAEHVARDIDARTGAEGAGGTEYQDKYSRWVDHYELNLDLTKLKTDPDSHLPRLIRTDTGELILAPVPPPLLGPIEIHNRKKEHLKREIAVHNHRNQRYNENYPNLDDNFKLRPIDDEGKLAPDIPHLPSLEDALERKAWKEYSKINHICPVNIPKHIKDINKAFSQDTDNWTWHYKEGKYKLSGPVSDE